MKSLLPLSFALALLCCVASPSGAAPLRTLTYHYEMDARGFGGAPGLAGVGTVVENGQAASYASSGTIRVDVINATADSGLVVDLTEHVDRQERDMQTVRCAVYGRDQSVVCDQNLNTTAEQTVLLQYIGRYFYEESRLDANRHWHVNPPLRGLDVENDYTVTKADGSVLTIKIDRQEQRPSYLARTEGTMVYDTAMSVPESIKISVDTLRSGSQGDMNVSLRLLSDSLAAASGQNSH